MQLPAQVRFTETYDPERLQADLDRTLSKLGYEDHPGPHDGWSIIALLDAGGSRWNRYNRSRPTKALEESPYVAEVLDSIGGPISWARYSRLKSGGYIRPHDDHALGFHTGHLRLHLPVTTKPDEIELIIDGEECRWSAGELWWGNFYEMHHVRNHWSEARVHMVIDVISTEGVLHNLPQDFADLIRESPEGVIAAEPIELTREQKSKFCTYFTVGKPMSPVPVIGKVELDGDVLRAEIPGTDRVYELDPVAEDTLVAFGAPAVKIEFDFEGDNVRSMVLKHVNSDRPNSPNLQWGPAEIRLECFDSLNFWQTPVAKIQQNVIPRVFSAFHYAAKKRVAWAGRK